MRRLIHQEYVAVSRAGSVRLRISAGDPGADTGSIAVPPRQAPAYMTTLQQLGVCADAWTVLELEAGPRDLALQADRSPGEASDIVVDMSVDSLGLQQSLKWIPSVCLGGNDGVCNSG